MKKLTIFLLLGGLSQAASAQGHKNPLDMMDKDGNGSISFAEFQENEPSLISRIDSNDDGLISLDEFLSQRPRRGPGPDGAQTQDENTTDSREQRREKRVARMTSRFQEMDLDGDELLSSIEIHEANFLRMDKDNNGALDVNELRRPRGSGPRQKRGDRPQRTAGAE